MKKGLKFVALGLVLVLIFVALAGCGGQTSQPEQEQEEKPEEAAPAAEPIKLVYAEVNPIDSVVGKMAVFFKEKVEEMSNGQIIITSRQAEF